MVNILSAVDPSKANKMMWNILLSFENLSAHVPNHKKLSSKKSITYLPLQHTQAPVFQKFVLG